MGKTLLLFLVFYANITFSQVIDSFEDGDFTHNPTWIGNSDAFIVNKAKQLQTTYSKDARTVALATANTLANNVQWEFYINMTFDPSPANRARIYLVSNKADLNADLNGYFIQIGENGNTDGYDLYRQSGSSITKIIQCKPKPRDNVDNLVARIKVTRDDKGKWELFADDKGGRSFALEGAVIDKVHTETSWFGVSCKYTTTRSDKFFFDDFLIRPLVDNQAPPVLLSARALDNEQVELRFNKVLSKTLAARPSNYSINNGIGSPMAVQIGEDALVVILKLGGRLSSGTYLLTVNGLKDLNGNEMPPNTSIQFNYVEPNMAQSINANDILINEVMFNPLAGQSDFVELFNPTSSTYDLRELALATVNALGEVVSIKNITGTAYLFKPGAYAVLSTKPEQLKMAYRIEDPKVFIAMPSMPAYNNEKGTVILWSKNKVIDRLDYTELMHHRMMVKVKGVSLERLSAQRPTNEARNFRSAAATAGYATPGYKNSQHIENNEAQHEVWLASKTFAPGQGGFDDPLTLHYSFNEAGKMGSVNVYSDRGVLVRKLLKNSTLNTSGTITWDGTNDSGQMGQLGVHIVVFEVFDVDGTVKKYTRACVLAAKLN